MGRTAVQVSLKSLKKCSVKLPRTCNAPSHVQRECCIFRVHNHLRDIRETAYTPQIAAIGPYHRSSSKMDSSSSVSSEEREVNYSMMEEHKWWYLRVMLKREGVNLDYFIQAIRRKVKRVRNFYAEPLSFNDDELAEMMVLDGCFIIELLRKACNRRLQQSDDPIVKIPWIWSSLQRDLMLFENQLPLFVLLDLFGMIERPNDQRFVRLVLKSFMSILPHPKCRRDRRECPLSQVRHLLELIHQKWCSEITSSQNQRMDVGESNHVIDLIPGCSRRRTSADNTGETRGIRCAIELKEAGVKFEKIKGKSLFDIRFTNGTLQIPTLLIGDPTEAILRNLIAYEQNWDGKFPQDRSSYVTEYVCFLDNLIDTSKDVEILCRHGIIDSLLGDGEVISDIFNKIGDSVIMPDRRDSCYYEIEKSVNSHCKKSWNRWMAMLRHNHFNSPWGITSVVAGFVLLFLTATQTYFAFFPRK